MLQKPDSIYASYSDNGCQEHSLNEQPKFIQQILKAIKRRKNNPNQPNTNKQYLGSQYQTYFNKKMSDLNEIS